MRFIDKLGIKINVVDIKTNLEYNDMRHFLEVNDSGDSYDNLYNSKARNTFREEIQVYFNITKINKFKFKLKMLDEQTIHKNEIYRFCKEEYSCGSSILTLSIKYHIIDNIKTIINIKYDSFFEFLYTSNLINIKQFILIDSYSGENNDFELFKGRIKTAFKNLNININFNVNNYVINVPKEKIHELEVYKNEVLIKKHPDIENVLLKHLSVMLPVNKIPDKILDIPADINIDGINYKIVKRNLSKIKFIDSFTRDGQVNVNDDKSVNVNSNKKSIQYQQKIIEYCKHIKNNYPQPYYVYKYTNKNSNLSYIGISSNLSSRQLVRFKTPSTPFDYTLRAIGADSFEFSVIGFAETKDGVLVLENKYIEMYDSMNNGYNMIKNSV